MNEFTNSGGGIVEIDRRDDVLVARGIDRATSELLNWGMPLAPQSLVSTEDGIDFVHYCYGESYLHNVQGSRPRSERARRQQVIARLRMISEVNHHCFEIDAE